jgi:hypothetical protein
MKLYMSIIIDELPSAAYQMPIGLSSRHWNPTFNPKYFHSVGPYAEKREILDQMKSRFILKDGRILLEGK